MVPNNRDGETRAVARLPNLDIEIRHCRPVDGDGEQILISLQPRPSFEAFGRFLDASTPLIFWLGSMQMVLSPWFGGLPFATQKTFLPVDGK
jgi:hypothetical protein